MRSLPTLSHGIAFEQTKTVSVSDNYLIISNHIKNVGDKAFEATEFCHNFICFDNYPVDHRYKMLLPYKLSASMRRGELLISQNSYRCASFDMGTGSSAFWISGYEGLSCHWMKLTHDELPLSLLIEEDFPLFKFFSWNTPHAFCPETFIHLSLMPGEERAFNRKYTFDC